MITPAASLHSLRARITAIQADLEVRFAGQSVQYKQVPLQLATEGNQIRMSETIPATLTDSQIDPPSLLAVPVKNEIPVQVGR